MTIGNKIKRRRIELGLSQIDLGTRMDSTKSYISQLENYPPKSLQAKTVSALCKALEVDIDFFNDAISSGQFKVSLTLDQETKNKLEYISEKTGKSISEIIIDSLKHINDQL